MKKCANCDFDNSDDATNCQSCNTETFVASSPAAIGGHNISPEEQRFWQRMTLRKFTILFIRIEGLFFLAYAIDEATYLPGYFRHLHNAVNEAVIADERSTIFWVLFRVFWHVAAVIAIIRYADRIASWLVKDAIPRRETAVSQESKVSN
jgi:hypothetical protein